MINAKFKPINIQNLDQYYENNKLLKLPTNYVQYPT